MVCTISISTPNIFQRYSNKKLVHKVLADELENDLQYLLVLYQPISFFSEI